MVQRVSKKRVNEINGAYKWTKEAINKRYPSIVKGVGRIKGNKFPLEWMNRLSQLNSLI